MKTRLRPLQVSTMSTAAAKEWPRHSASSYQGANKKKQLGFKQGGLRRCRDWLTMGTGSCCLQKVQTKAQQKDNFLRHLLEDQIKVLLGRGHPPAV